MPSLLATIGFALLLATLPLALELLILSAAAALPQPAPATQAASDFRLAIVIPAHNEQVLIAPCVRSILAQSTAQLAVYVIAHNCTDETAQRASAAGAEALLLSGPIGGKGIALDFGFRHALARGAEGVLVLDADSIAGPNLVGTVAAALASGAEAVQCRYEAANADATPRSRLAALALLGMNVVRPLGRSRIGLSCGIFGNGFALSAATLARVPYVANSLVEDLEYHLHLIRGGINVRFLAQAAVFGEMPDNSAAAGSQRARWEGGRILMRRTWSKPLLREVLRGNLRLLEPLLDLLALPLATECVLLALALLLSFAAHLVWLSIYASLGLFAVLLYLLVAASLAPEPLRTLQALAAAPAYLAWKILLIPRTRLAARRNAAWVRTRRNAEEAKPRD